MIFDQQKWPILNALAKEIPYATLLKDIEISWDTNSQNYDETIVNDFWQHIIDKSDANYFITNPVRKIVDEDQKAIQIIEKEIYKPDFTQKFTGTISYIIPDETIPANFRNTTALINILPENDWNFFSFALYIGYPAIMLGMIGGRFRGKEYELIINYGVDADALLEKFIFFQQFLFFIDHCTEKQRFIIGKNHKRKIKTSTKEKFLNKIEIPIEIIDSSFYTTTIRTNGFKVNGHWRHQAYGEERKKRKLIWIRDFQKNGITINAKKQF